MPRPATLEKPTEVYPGLANRFLHFRTKYISKNQTQAAELISTTQASLSRIESGNRLPSARIVSTMVVKYGLNQEWLYKNTGDPKLKGSENKPSNLMLDITQITADMKKLLAIHDVMAKQQSMLFNKIERLEKQVEEQQKIIDSLRR